MSFNLRDTPEALLVCPWPKYKGEAWEGVVEKDRAYVEWLVGGEGPTMDAEVYDALIEFLEEAG